MQIGGRGLVAKAGAEGVHAWAVVGEGLAMAIKVDDGHDRGYHPEPDEHPGEGRKGVAAQEEGVPDGASQDEDGAGKEEVTEEEGDQPPLPPPDSEESLLGGAARRGPFGASGDRPVAASSQPPLRRPPDRDLQGSPRGDGTRLPRYGRARCQPRSAISW